MKKYILSFIAMWFGLISVQAESISVPGVNIQPGSTSTVGISLNNTETNLVSFQMDLTLPEGITVNKAGCSLSSRFTDAGQELTIGKQGTNVYRLVSTSFSLAPISGTSGEIITLSLTAAANNAGGTATISNIRFVTSNSEKITLSNASFNITTHFLVNSISLSETALTFRKAGETATLTATAAPSNATNKSVTWTSSNTAVATVDNNGLVTAVANGTATITATANDGSNVSASCAVTISPYDITSNDIFFRITDENAKTAEVTFVEEGEGNADFYFGSISVPRRVTKDGVIYTVTAVGENAFNNCTDLTSVTLPATIMSINERAFYNCPNLTTVNIPDGVTAIGESAFYYCTGLTSVTIPEGVTAIEGFTFYKCTGLESVTLPESLISIGEEVFCDCYNIASIEIPSSVTTIKRGAFGGCSLISSITLPQRLSTLEDWAFNRCSNLTAITIPTNVSIIDEGTFNGCEKLAAVTFQGNVTTIKSQAFQGCSRLTSFTFPESVTSIGGNAFNNCSNLTSVTMPASVINFTGDYAFGENNNIESVYITDMSKWLQTPFNQGNNPLRSGARLYLNNEEVKNLVIPEGTTSILTAAFEGCESLTSVVIPSSVTAINPHAFASCPNLKAMVVNNTTPMSISTPQSLGTIFVPNESVDVYKAAEGWSTFADRIQPQTGWTFTAAVPCGEGTADLTFKVTSANPWEVEVSASPEDIAGALTIPASVQNENGIEFAVKTIGENAFKGRPLTSVELPTGLIEIGNSAFAECSYLTTINLPEGIRRFGFWAFSGSGLVSVVLPEGITDFCNAVFAGCTNLSSVEWPSDLTTISSWTFYQCSKLSSFDIPNTVSVIKDNTFRESGLESIKFPSTLTSVGHDAFSDCKSLTSIDFNRCPANFEYNSFYGCSSLEELYIPNTVKFLNNGGTWAWNNFGHCSSLRSVVFEAFEAGQQRWSTPTVFPDCPALETVVLPSTSVMQNGFFARCDNLRSVTFLEISDDFTPRTYNFSKMFQFLDPNKIHFTVPEGHAEELLKAGYINISDLSALPMARAEFEAQATRITTMMNALSDGDKATLTAAISSARSAANAAEDYATVYAQITAIKTTAKTYLSTATLPDGFDMTAALLSNPDFDQLQLGWDFNQYWATWPNVNQRGWNEAAYENGDVSIDKFIDTWEQTTLLDGQITQTINAMPAGIYRLEADIIATKQDDASAEVTGVSLFAGNKSIAVATENKKPQHFSFKFENTLTKDVTIGININGTNANWVAMDNVRLIYEGKAADIPQGIDLVSNENARVYLYNVETGKYLSAGHSGGTHAMLDETGLPIRLTQNPESGLWQIYFWEGSKSNQLLFKDYESNEVYVDYDPNHSNADEDLTLWSITTTGEGGYLIQNKMQLNTGDYLGNIPTRQDAQINYTGVSYTDLINTATVNDNSHWLIFTKENSDQLAAKYRLMAAILRMEASDNVNDELLAAARTVYNNADATAAEVIDITTQLNSQMGMPAENQPVDMTALIINPRFENNTTEGWSGANVVGGRADATSNHEQEFYEKDFNMYQTITGVPNGIYRLKWKGLHRPGSCDQVYNEFNAGTDNASAVVYANNTQKTMLNWATGAGDADLGDWQANGVSYPNSMEAARKHFDAGLYADFLEVEVTDNVLTIGVKNTEPMASRHWVVFSDFELYILENAEQAHNKLVTSTAKGLQGGKAQLPILMDNEASIAGVQFKIRTPEGMTVGTDGSGDPKVSATSRVNGMTIMSAQREDYTQVLIYGIGKNVKGNSGAIINVALDIANTLELGDYKVDIYDIVLTATNGLRITPFSVKSTVTLVDAESGDANHDGEVDVADIIAVANYILGRPSAQFDEIAANVNGDTSIDVADIIGIANIILHGRQALAPSVKNMEDKLDPQ